MINRIVKNILGTAEKPDMDKVIVVEDSDSENESSECIGSTAQEHSQRESRRARSGLDFECAYDVSDLDKSDSVDLTATQEENDAHSEKSDGEPLINKLGERLRSREQLFSEHCADPTESQEATNVHSEENEDQMEIEVELKRRVNKIISGLDQHHMGELKERLSELISSVDESQMVQERKAESKRRLNELVSGLDRNIPIGDNVDSSTSQQANDVQLDENEYEALLEAIATSTRKLNEAHTNLPDIGNQEANNVQLDEYVDQMVQERTAELKRTSETSTTTTIQLETEAEAMTIEEEEEATVEEEEATNKKLSRNDPYAGYFAPNGRNKRQRTKIKRSRVDEVEYDQMDIASTHESRTFNGVTVSYSEATMPPDMKK